MLSREVLFPRDPPASCDDAGTTYRGGEWAVWAPVLAALLPAVLTS